MSDVTFTMRPRKAGTLSHETVVVDLEIRNARSHVIHLPDPMEHTSPTPHYRLERPDGSAVDFSPTSRLPPGMRREPRLIAIPPGGTWTGEISVDAWSDILAAGDYTLHATLDWESVHAKADAIRFSVQPLRLQGLVLADHQPRSANMLHAVTVQQEGARYQAIAFYVSELTFYGRELKVDGVMPIGDLREPPRQLARLFTSDLSMSLPLALIGATPTTLIIAPHGGPEIRIPFHAPLRQLLPALVVPAPSNAPTSLDALAVFQGPSADLGHVHIADLSKGGAGLAVRTVTSLGPNLLVAAATRGGAADGGSPMLVTWLAAQTDATKVGFLKLSSAGEVVSRGEVSVPAMVALPQIAVHIDTKGRVDASFVGRSSLSLAGAPVGSLHLVEMQGSVSELPNTWRSTSIDGSFEPKQVLIDYGNERAPNLPGVFLRSTDGRHRFFRPGRRTVEIASAFSEKDEIALLGVACWYLLINDGTKVRSHRLDCETGQ